jgi:hypothetical protein
MAGVVHQDDTGRQNKRLLMFGTSEKARLSAGYKNNANLNRFRK